MTIEKLAAIDIGSNAIRLLIQNAVAASPHPRFIKACLLRLPIRLGTDVFRTQCITPVNEVRILKAIRAFQLVMEVHGVARYRALATSAMRTAFNGEAVVARVRAETGIQIEIIDGQTEAALLLSGDLKTCGDPLHDQLFIDVGGGSTELTLLSGGAPLAAHSFALGTIRFLEGQFSQATWEEMRAWVHQQITGRRSITLVGSGGNINKLFKLSGVKIGKPLSHAYVHEQYQKLKRMTYEQRISELGLNPDRADVIVPALKLYSHVMRWTGAQQLYVPKIGLSDGIIRSLYLETL